MSMLAEHDNVVVWVEIPAADFERAVTFYETILDTRLNRETFGGPRMGVFAYDRPKVSGCVMEAPERAGSDGGTLIYLNCTGHLDAVVARVEAAGGAVLTPRIDLPPGMGAYFHIRDSEGNRVGLHAAS